MNEQHLWRPPPPPLRVRQPLRFGATVIAALMGGLIAGAILWVGVYLYVDHQISQVSDAINDTISGSSMSTPKPTAGIDDCWDRYMGEDTDLDFDPWAATHCSDAERAQQP